MKKVDKDLLINPFPLSDRDTDEVKALKTTSLTAKQLNEVIFLIDLCDSVSLEYEGYVSDAFEWAVRGLRESLMAYRDNQLHKPDRPKLITYATWFMDKSVSKAKKEVKQKKK